MSTGKINDGVVYKPSEYFFERFDPLNCTQDDLGIPESYAWFMYGVILRARDVLKNRSLSEIYYAADTLDFIESRAQHEISMKSTKRLSRTGEKQIVTSITMAYYGYIPLFDISEQSDFKNATWAEYFAVLALTRVGRVINALKRVASDLEKQFNIDIEETREQYAFGHSIDATEAISYAECLQGEADKEKAEVTEAAKNQISLRNQSAAIKRFADTNSIKDEFIPYYLDGMHTSKADAARKFYASLPDFKKKHFRADTIERNLLDHLRKHTKQ